MFTRRTKQGPALSTTYRRSHCGTAHCVRMAPAHSTQVRVSYLLPYRVGCCMEGTTRRDEHLPTPPIRHRRGHIANSYRNGYARGVHGVQMVGMAKCRRCRHATVGKNQATDSNATSLCGLDGRVNRQPESARLLCAPVPACAIEPSEMRGREPGLLLRSAGRSLQLRWVPSLPEARSRSHSEGVRSLR